MIGLSSFVAERSDVNLETGVFKPLGVECYIPFNEVLSELKYLCQFLVLIPATEEIVFLRGTYWWLDGRTGNSLHTDNLGTAIAVECDGKARIVFGYTADHGIVILAPLPIIQLFGFVILSIPTFNGGIQQVNIILTLKPFCSSDTIRIAPVMRNFRYLTVLIDVLGIVSVVNIVATHTIIDVTGEEVIDKSVSHYIAVIHVSGNKPLVAIIAVARSFDSGT